MPASKLGKHLRNTHNLQVLTIHLVVKRILGMIKGSMVHFNGQIVLNL